MFDMLDNYPLSWPVAALLAVIFLSVKYIRSPTHQLRHIPSVGGSGLISSYFDARRFFREGQQMIQEGYEKYYGTAFKVSTMGRYMVVVSGSDMLEDIRQATDEQLSFREAIAETIQADYMLGKQNRTDPFHIAVVRTPLTRNLGYRFPEIKDEIQEAFGEMIPPTGEWTKTRILSTARQIVCRTSNRLFVGLPLCRDPDYRKLNEQFTGDVMRGAQTINRFPKLLRPIVGRYLTKIPARAQRTIKHIGPIIEERLANEKLYGPEAEDTANDLITWLLEEAKGPQRTTEQISLRVLGINFAAIHTTSMALTNALYDLAAYPQYVEAMREEVEAVISSEGWTKAAMGKMRKVDSFLKESQRLATGGLSVSRKALKDFTFSNGITVPAGTFVAFATHSTHHDDHVYPDADTFDGFRFSEKREGDGEGIKHQMVALSHDYITFGTGRHACPGRFFAVNELKAMLAHILMTYDVKLPENTPRPPNIWFQTTCSPNPYGSLFFRKRA
ncbi:hypothetical protein HYPSUDRAFT_47536 [Hypholoma sublateritium FD-334 SS-4]|uniref:Cytochrome P450 n=1 Tax=Hypholoma sublateritium (strain FD-334 SS-4) TaxID=945553 RepID=A0A0D2NHZ4_HYPSF|nr:hypothetical protein HYPSUDRAFT_47536 [Hypholoma sublateritium FD-334 SS-4]